MRAFVTLLSLLLFTSSAFAVEITCRGILTDEGMFPEAPIAIQLGSEEDTFTMMSDDEVQKLKATKEDRLRWDIPGMEDFLGVRMFIDARKQKLEFYEPGEDGKLIKDLAMVCENAEEAEQEFISNLLLPGKLEAAGYPRDLFVIDGPRDAADFVPASVVETGASSQAVGK